MAYQINLIYYIMTISKLSAIANKLIKQAFGVRKEVFVVTPIGKVSLGIWDVDDRSLDTITKSISKNFSCTIEYLDSHGTPKTIEDGKVTVY